MIYDTWDLLEKVNNDLQAGSGDMGQELKKLKQGLQDFQTKLKFIASINAVGEAENVKASLFNADTVDQTSTLNDAIKLKELIMTSQELYTDLYQYLEIMICLRSEDFRNRQYGVWLDEINVLSGLYESCKTLLDHLLSSLTEPELQSLLRDPDLKEIEFILNERVQNQASKQSPEIEKAFQLMEASGLHAWGDLFAHINGRVNDKLVNCNKGENEEHTEDQTEENIGEVSLKRDNIGEVSLKEDNIEKENREESLKEESIKEESIKEESIKEETRKKKEKVDVNSFRNTLYYGEDREVRLAYFERWKEAWQSEADLCAAALNNIAGFRLNLYESRGYESDLTESLQQNRVQEATVKAMWKAVDTYKQPFIEYLKRKKELFHAEHLSWSDQLAPLPIEVIKQRDPKNLMILTGQANQTNQTKISFEEAIQFIASKIQHFDQEFADFIQMAAQKQWIEARITDKKTVGAFCASFPKWNEPRVMMSFYDDLPSAGVLAHELGHAYHYYLIYKLPMFLQDIPPTVAEISSTLTETLVMREAVAQTNSMQEKIKLLDYQIIRDIGTILNTYVRYLFEIDFYDKRKQGNVSVDELNQLMLHAQQRGFGDVFDSYEPTFWASLRHFYMTRKPFVHYPYTVAHLVSTGIYTLLMKRENGGDILRNILMDSSRLTVEEIGKEHLGVNLQEEYFWRSSLEHIYENVQLFLELTRDLK